jgi:DNA-binding NarL/FixJ family response regulator
MASFPSSVTSVLLVDHQQMFTEALSRLLASEPDLDPVGSARTVAQAVAACERLHPDVVLVDLRVSDMHGVEGIRMIRKEVPGSSVIVVTDRDDSGAISAAIQAGAKGYVLKTRAVEELIAIIRQASAGETILMLSDTSNRAGRRRFSRQRENEPQRAFARLTVRESEILTLLAHGRSTAETAAALHISPLTVRSHVKSILGKLGVHSKVEAVSYALRSGLVEIDRPA